MTSTAIKTALAVLLGASFSASFSASFAACSHDSAPAPDAAPPGHAPRAVIAAGDYNMGHPGVLSTLDPATRSVQRNAGPAMAVGDDPVLRHFGNELFIVNRSDGNNVTILDDLTFQLKEQLATGAGSNPQDVAALGGKLYVATFGTAGVTVLTRGSTATTVIDLSADDPDGKPNCNSVYLVGTDLYVACELLDNTDKNLTPRGPGKVYVIDTAAGTVKATLTLGHKNPFTLFEQIPAGAPHAGDLLVATVEDFVTAPGCIERVATGASPAAAGCVIDNAMLGGYPTRFDVQVSGGTAVLWTAVARTDFQHASLRAYDLMRGSLWSSPLSPDAQVIADVVHCPEDQVVVVDSTMSANGLRIYANATEQTTAALPIGLGFFSQHGLVCY